MIASEAKAGSGWLQGVSAEWLALFDMPRLEQIGAELAKDPTAPPAPLVFEAFRFGRPFDTLVVVIGQDPYPTPGDAQGLAFSTPRGRPLPRSLKTIFDCLAAGNRRRRPAVECGDLSSWAAQGVLLLNVALTTRPGSSGDHLKLWYPFTSALVAALCAQHPGPLHFFLWGDVAAKAAAVARQRHTVHTWTHPSPSADNRLGPALRFRNCPHFAAVSGIRWDNLAPAFAFCDGACSANGSAAAAAGFAVVLAGGPFRRGSAVWGRVEPRAYRFRPGIAGPAAVCPEGPEAAAVQPSNNRAELLAIIHGFLALLRARALGRVEVVSDSLIAIETLTKWLPARLARGQADELKNRDLLDIAAALLERLRAQATRVYLTHERGHQRQNTAASPRAAFLWKGNGAADRLAVQARQMPRDGPAVFERGAATWRAFA